MNYLALFIGSIVTAMGLAIVVLTIVFLRENRVRNAVTGLVLVLLGFSLVWLGFRGSGSLYINMNMGISDKQFGILLVSFVMSLFILKGVLDIREGSKRLQDKTISSFLVFKSKFQIIVAIIVTTFVVFILLAAFWQFGR